jgi:uncharacterized protein YjcR
MPSADTPPDAQASARRQARALYWMGWRVSHIAAHLRAPRSTVSGWRKAGHWDDVKPADRVEGALEERLCALIGKAPKSGGDYKEIDLLGRQIERLARVRRYAHTGKEADLNPAIDRRNAGPKKRAERNVFSAGQIEQVKAAFTESLFAYQRQWWQAGAQRTRAILKSRQIGATWYFAREALVDALETGRNQIFLSASKAQAHIFRQYITAFAFEVCGVELTGDPIALANGAALHFLGSNARTAQGYHGNFYFDEFFWTQRFEELNKVASGMAMHTKWRKTYFSTPSSLQHEAYAFWSGARHNKKRARQDQIEIDTTHERLAQGEVGADKVWRQIVTIADAQAGGCDLFDVEELRLEYSAEEFDNLLMCGFVDESFAVFPLADLLRCHVDSWDAWHDFKPFAQRPYGWRPVWVGYDPSHTGDAAGLVVLAPPTATPPPGRPKAACAPGTGVAGASSPADGGSATGEAVERGGLISNGKFRVLHREQFRGAEFEQQAAAIEAVTRRYNVASITIDTSGLGQGVYQLVRQFFPAARGLQYSPEVKGRLVLKAQSVMRAGRLEFDAGDVDLQRSFMAIKRELTGSGRGVTFAAGRSQGAGHADLAWACMNALDNEPLESAAGGVAARSILEIY